MKPFLVLLGVATVAITFLLLPFAESEARRLGGGSSFGSKPTYSQPKNLQRSTVDRTPTAAQTQNQARRAQLAQRGGLWGMLGGLALGGLLGALFFGGAFEGINFLDILLFAGIAFLLYYLFVMRRRSQGLSPAAAHGPAPGPSAYSRQAAVPRTGAGFDTDLLFKDKPGAEPMAATEIPADFDQRRFLDGATNAYRRLQAAWDQGDLADIREFTTDPVFTEIESQFAARSGENRTELFKVDAELLEVRQVGDQMEASVLFDVLMRESDSDDTRPYQVREVWHFVRPARSERPTWFLDGIQQLEG